MANCILNTFKFYQCAALRCLLLLLPCCSLSWCTSRCNSTEFHRTFSYSTGLHISPEIQAWTFNSFCPTLDYQESEESKRVQQTPRSATVLQGIDPKPHRDDSISSTSCACRAVCYAPLATPEVIPNSALLSSPHRLHSGCTGAILWDLFCQLSHARGLRLPPLTV